MTMTVAGKCIMSEWVNHTGEVVHKGRPPKARSELKYLFHSPSYRAIPRVSSKATVQIVLFRNINVSPTTARGAIRTGCIAPRLSANPAFLTDWVPFVGQRDKICQLFMPWLPDGTVALSVFKIVPSASWLSLSGLCPAAVVTEWGLCCSDGSARCILFFCLSKQNIFHF